MARRLRTLRRVVEIGFVGFMVALGGGSFAQQPDGNPFRLPSDGSLFPPTPPATPAPAPRPGLEPRPPLGISSYPTITIMEPTNGAILNTKTPNIIISFHDAASGIDPTTFRVFINGIDRTALFNVTGSGASFRVPPFKGPADRSAEASPQFSSFSLSPEAVREGEQGREIISEGQNLIIAMVRNKAGFPATTSSSFIVDLRAALTSKGIPRSPIELSFLLPPPASLPSKELPPPEPPSLSRDLVQFGYDQFAQPASTFAPVTDVPVGPDYVLGPGDTLLVYMWGMVDNVLTLPVNQQGEVFLPKMGTFPIWGMTLSQAEKLIKDQLSRHFSGFKLSFAMAGLRTIKVFVIGEVARPGSYTLSSLATVTNALFAAGGPTKMGSLRQIKLLRNNHLVGTVDLYEFLLKGDKRQDFRLESGDTIFVPPIGPVVGISGSVKRPGIYELNGSTRVSHLIAMAGGALPTGYLKRIQVERVEAHTKKVVLDLDLAGFYNGGDPSADIELKEGDLVKVFPVEARILNAVTLQGFVKYPGEYELKPTMRLSDLLTPEKLLPEAYLDHVEIIRVKFPELNREILTANVKQLFQGDRSQDLELQPLDTIVVGSEFRSQEKVTLQGEVKRPGSYAIVKGERLSSVLKRAGGFTDKAYLRAAVFTRESVKKVEREKLEEFIKVQEQRLIASASAIAASGLSKEEAAAQQQLLTQQREALRLAASQVVLGRVVIRLDELEKFEGSADDIPLEDGDSLIIPTRPSSVLVLGSVRNPTAVLYKDGENVDYYLNMAGGLTKEADKKELHIVKADGSTVSSFLKIRRVEPGDIIIAPPKVEPKYRPLPLWRDIASIIGQFSLTITAIAALVAL